MKIRRGDTAVITGGSRGIGRHIAGALADRGVNLVLVARSASGLETVAAGLADKVDVELLAADLSDRASVARLVAMVESRCGAIDLLVNNAGVEGSRRFDEHTDEDLARFTDVNLLAPMMLTRAVLPGMIARRRGHIVNIASVAGLIPSAYEEPYNATKFGLVGFTRSLRMTARDQEWGISASAICPGFTSGAGMFEDMRSEFGVQAPRMMRPLSVDRVSAAVVRAVERDCPEVIVMSGTPRSIAAAAAASPRLFERLADRLNLAAPFRAIAAQRSTARPG